jgi:hypothetical protein
MTGRPRSTARFAGRDIIGLIAVAAGLGVALGLAWWWLAPGVLLDVYADGDGFISFPAEYQPRGYITDDAIAAIASLVGGALTVIVAMILSARRMHRVGLAALAWSIGAGVVGAVLLWWVGTTLGAVDLQAAMAEVGEGGQVEAGLTLRMPGVLLLWPLGSAMVFCGYAVLDWIIRGREPAARIGPGSPARDR